MLIFEKHLASVALVSGVILTKTALNQIEKRKSQFPGKSMSVNNVCINDEGIMGVVEYPHDGRMLQHNVSVRLIADQNELHKCK